MVLQSPIMDIHKEQKATFTKEDHTYWQDKLHLVEVEYGNGLTLENFKDGCDWLGIAQGKVMEDRFGIEPLSEEEKAQLEKDLELLVRCVI